MGKSYVEKKKNIEIKKWFKKLLTNKPVKKVINK